MAFSKHVTDKTRILCDLFVTIENIIKGTSLVTQEEYDNFIRYKVDPPANQPIVLMFYEKSSETRSNLDFKLKEVGRCEQRSCLSPDATENVQETEWTHLVSKNNVQFKACIVDVGVAYTSNTLNEKKMTVDSASDVMKNCSEHAEVMRLKKERMVDAEVPDHYMQFFQENIAQIKKDKIDLEANRDEDSVNQISSSQTATKDDDKRDSGHDEKSNCHSIDTEGKQMANDDSMAKSNVCVSNTKTLKKNTAKETRKKGKIYKCNYCSRPFSYMSAKEVHERIHTGEKPFKCSYCDQAFARRTTKEIHERIHTGEKPFKCRYCNKAYKTRPNKKIHERIHTGEKPFKCRYCDKVFTRKPEKKIHERIHTGEKPYTCDYCNKSFNILNNKHRHMRTHTGEKPYACDFCNKKFSDASHKARHERLHTGETPYACDFCNKKFTDVSHKWQHEKLHTGEKPFACGFCNKKFSQPGNKERHERLHTGDKRHHCEYCEKTFITRNEKIEHERTHTGEMPYTCAHCNKKFRCRSSKNQHEKCAHKN